MENQTSTRQFTHQKYFYDHADQSKEIIRINAGEYVKNLAIKTITKNKLNWDPDSDKQALIQLIAHSTVIHHFWQKIDRMLCEDHFVQQNQRKYQRLTPREKEIIALIVNGFNNPQIADKLSISRYTVEQHRKNINRKLSISSFSDLFKFSYAFDMFNMPNLGYLLYDKLSIH